MEAYSNALREDAQAEPQYYVAQSNKYLAAWMGGCPHAQTCYAYSLELDRDVLISCPCKRWGCAHCGPIRVADLARRVRTAEPNRLITLTCDPKLFETPRAAFDRTRRKLGDFNKEVRKHVGPFEYCRVLEITKKGWPHYHMLARCGYIPQATISKVWAELTGAPIVDIRCLHKDSNVYAYVTKYLTKQRYVSWTNRRVSWSAKFFPKAELPDRVNWRLINKAHYREHPTDWAAENWSGVILERVGPYAWSPATIQNQGDPVPASGADQLDICIESCGKNVLEAGTLIESVT